MDRGDHLIFKEYLSLEHERVWVSLLLREREVYDGSWDTQEFLTTVCEVNK